MNSGETKEKSGAKSTTNNNNRKELEPPDGGYGWIIIIACTVISSSLMPLMQCFGIIYEAEFARMGITATQTSFLLHLYSSVTCSLGLFSGPILKKYNYKQVSLCGSLLVCIGIIATSFVTSYGHLIFTCCFLVGIGQGVIMPSTSLAVNSYFKKRLTLAMSFSITGVGLLPIIMPQVCNALLNIYGTHGTVLILGGIALHAVPAALLLRPIRRKKSNPITSAEVSINSENLKDLEAGTEKLLQTNKVYNETTKAIPKEPIKNCDKTRSNLSALFNLELFKERAYVIIIIGMSISYVAELNFVLMTPFVLSELASFTNSDIALAMSIQAAADIIGRLFIPLVSHKSGWSPKLMYAASLGGSSFGRTVLAIFCDTRNVVLASSVFLGLSKGAKAVFQSLILPKYVSLEELPSAMGFLMVINGILSLIIGPLIGAVHDISNSYAYTVHAATFLSLFCVVVWTVDYYEMKISSKSVPSTTKYEESGI